MGKGKKCTALIANGLGPLRCTLEPDHPPGHVFAASDAPDRHSDEEDLKDAR